MTTLLTNGTDNEVVPFDFDAHRAQAIEDYRQVHGSYVDFARVVRDLLRASIDAQGLKVQSIDQRAKSEDSFGLKASRASDTEGLAPAYSEPLKQIQDLAGCRVITFFVDDVAKVRNLVAQEFSVLESVNRSSRLRGSGRPGYESYHFIVALTPQRNALPEYARFKDMVAEVQVRTILQHAWAEIEHDIQYKSVDALPSEIGQRFQSLAGLIEIGDREFQAIANAHNAVRQQAAISLEQGRLSDVELTAESLKAYLDKHFGPDGRMRDWSYEWTATNLRRMGFENLAQLAECIGSLDVDRLSRDVWGSRQGQLTRLDLALLAGMGPDAYKARHPWGANPDTAWFPAQVDRHSAALQTAGHTLGSYTPS